MAQALWSRRPAQHARILPTKPAWPGSGSCQGSSTASRRKSAALTQAFLSGPDAPPCGESTGGDADETSMPKAKTETPEVMVEADTRSLLRLRCMRRNGNMLLSDLLPSCPVHPSNEVNTFAFLHIVSG